MGCGALRSRRQVVPMQVVPIHVAHAELPNLLNISKANRELGSAVAARHKRGSAVLEAIDSACAVGQLSGAEAVDLLTQVAQEANEIDQETKPMIALVSHDNMKPLMASFAKSYAEPLRDFRLTGTGTTCKVLRAVGLEPEDRNVPSGPLGGDQVLGAMICECEIRALFFFQDPLSSHAHAADISALSRLCNVYQIYFATNYRTAAAVLEQMHSNLKQRGVRIRASIRVPHGMTTDLAEIVQEQYKQTRQLAVAAAV